MTYPGVEAPRSIAATRLTAKRTKGIASMDGLKADARDRGAVMQALPPSKEVKLIVPIHDVETFLGGGGQPSRRGTGKPLRAAPILKPPALPGDIYSDSDRGAG